MAAMVPSPRHRCIQQLANMLRNKSMLLKLEHIIVFTMYLFVKVSDSSPGTAAPKMNKSFVHMAHVSSDLACAQDGYLKRPHPTIIDGDMRWESG